MTAAKSELREALGLDELERRTRSLRALPVAPSYRDLIGAAASSGFAGDYTEDATDVDGAPIENTVQAAFTSCKQSLGALETELEAGLASGRLVLESLMDRRFAVYTINQKHLDGFRELGSSCTRKHPPRQSIRRPIQVPRTYARSYPPGTGWCGRTCDVRNQPIVSHSLAL